METHILFFILAGLLVVILVGYSLWSARREKSRVFSNTFATRPISTPISSGTNNEVPSVAPSFTQPSFVQESESQAEWQGGQEEIANQVQEIKIKLANQPEMEVAPQPEPVFSQPMPEVHIKIESEPVQPEPEIVSEEPSSEDPQIENNLITLYVVAPQGQMFNGLDVTEQLDLLGLQYGEYQIFHRHIDNANSPVLFSVANMMQPGIFEMNQIERFSTVGLAFFMQLPSPTNDLANMRIMINTAESLAKSLGGFVLDDKQQIFDENARQAYLLRTRQH